MPAASSALAGGVAGAPGKGLRPGAHPVPYKGHRDLQGQAGGGPSPGDSVGAGEHWGISRGSFNFIIVSSLFL